MGARLFFVSSLPRSGSTLLMNLLGQNPAHYVTPTSGLIELFVLVKNRWPDVIEFKAEGLEVVKPRVASALKGLLTGYFQHELAAGKSVFDKSRGWLQYIEPLEETLGVRVKVVVTVRDVRAIVTSFERLYRRRQIDFREARGEEYFLCQTVEGRAEVLLEPSSILGLTIARLRDALARGLGDRLVIVPYDALTAQPQPCLSLVHLALNLPPFQYDPHRVTQVTQENDTIHGMALHTIRTVVEPAEPTPWDGVLPPRFCRWLEVEYADINSLAAWQEAGKTSADMSTSAKRDSTVIAEESPQDLRGSVGTGATTSTLNSLQRASRKLVN